MLLPSLYRICLDRIYSLLQEGMWKTCTPNPFSLLPTKLLDDLMENVLPKDYVGRPTLDDVILPLTSGRLTRLNLWGFDLYINGPLKIKALQVEYNTSLGYHVSHSGMNFFYGTDYLCVLRYIISSNPYLEELYLEEDPGSDVIRECKDIRILRIYSSREIRSNDYSSINLSMLSSLRNLEVLFIRKMKSISMVGNVLEKCPKLISIGLCDSLDSLDKIAQRRLNENVLNLDVGRIFKLLRCVWGKSSRIENYQVRLEYKCRFREKIVFAVHLCPFIKELILNVHEINAIKNLMYLKHLSLLRLDFRPCEDDFKIDFVELLQVIGVRLDHLSILATRRIPVGDISEYCPRLQSLEIEGPKYVKSSSDASAYLPIKRLRLNSIAVQEDIETLIFLLSVCKHVEELFLFESDGVDDTLVRQILLMNPLSELTLCCIDHCRITREGFAMIIKNAASIETALITSHTEEFFHDANIPLEDAYFQGFKAKEFFHRRLNATRF